ncbi:MAG: ECF RNA polymerase sigma factor SigE [Bacteroidia bacterium]|nr:ECF RNA polymerase sigma factor SigE [Bacteroidia bacterium]
MSTETATEINVIALIKQGDERVFEQVFREHYKALCGYATRFLKEKEGAEEIVQDIFFKLWEKRETLEINSSLKSYLFRAVHNRCLNTVRHIDIRENYKADNEARIKAEEENITEQFNRFELQQQIQKAIDALPEQRQKIFKLSRLQGLKYREIAEQMQLSEKTVEAQMSKALKSLREDLKDYLPSLVTSALLLWELMNRIN